MTTQLGMDPGQLTEEIEILEKASVDDGQGGRITQYVGIPNGFEWARIRRLSASERRSAQQSGSPAQYEVTIRYRDDLTAAHRLRWVGKRRHPTGPDEVHLEIISAPLDLDERGDYLVFHAATARAG